jgi:hypothetical protein
MRLKNLKVRKESFENQLKTVTSQDIKKTLEDKIKQINTQLDRGKVLKAGKFTDIYEKADALYRREELTTGPHKV